MQFLFCNSILFSVHGFSLLSFSLLQGFTDDQLVLVQQNSVLVEEREREIRLIVQSISDLNEIFKDLAGMVVEQVRCDFYILINLFIYLNWFKMNYIRINKYKLL